MSLKKRCKNHICVREVVSQESVLGGGLVDNRGLGDCVML